MKIVVGYEKITKGTLVKISGWCTEVMNQAWLDNEKVNIAITATNKLISAVHKWKKGVATMKC